MKNKKNREENMKNITLKQLEKILISLIKKIDKQASNIRVVEELGIHHSKIIVDYIYEDEFKSLNEYDKEWVSFGIGRDGYMFYDVDGVQGRNYFGHQDYAVDLQTAWAYVQQQLAKFNVHSESYYGQDGIHEQIFDGKSYINLEEDVFARKPSEASQKACSEAFYRDFPEYREENA
tara:strand:- start:25 stop:555 length:531 start_codon:yes stop_codon:yes gene_type:complete